MTATAAPPMMAAVRRFSRESSAGEGLEDGTLDLLVLTRDRRMLTLTVLVKCLAHWTASVLPLVIAAVGLQSLLLFHGYALLFSSPPMNTSRSLSTSRCISRFVRTRAVA